jgi:tetratricopeptide (TPR) repeat protein
VDGEWRVVRTVCYQRYHPGPDAARGMSQPGMGPERRRCWEMQPTRGQIGCDQSFLRRHGELPDGERRGTAFCNDRFGLAATYHTLGGVALDRGNLDAAEHWYREECKIAEAIGNRLGLANTYHQLGMVAQGRHDLDAAEIWFRKSLEDTEKLQDRRGLAATYGQLGIVAMDRGNLNAAESWYQKVLKIREALEDRPGLAILYHQLGRVARSVAT